MTRRAVALALVHYPVLDKQGEIVTTSITNLDVHDIARSTYTYGVSPYFIVHPVSAQRELVQSVKDHWTLGSGARRIPDRQPPLGAVEIVETLEAARLALAADATHERARASKRLVRPSCSCSGRAGVWPTR
jgi:hypothetical protein